MNADMNPRGGLTVDRDSLHASPGYARQVEAAKQLQERRVNADVEKAVGVITDHIADLTRCIGVLAAYPEMKPVASEFEKAMKELTPVAQALRDQEAELRVLRVKCAGTLANNLCPDHRDKQVGKPCLACSIEKSEALLRECQKLFRPKPYSGSYEVISLIGRITAHLGAEHD